MTIQATETATDLRRMKRDAATFGVTPFTDDQWDFIESFVNEHVDCVSREEYEEVEEDALNQAAEWLTTNRDLATAGRIAHHATTQLEAIQTIITESDNADQDNADIVAMIQGVITTLGDIEW